jgi:transposase
MNIKFTGHQSTERNLELSQKDLFQLFEIMKEEFKEHITYARFDRIYSPTKLENMIKDYCQQHGVDIEYTKDRTAFFYSIMNNLKNPYQ